MSGNDDLVVQEYQNHLEKYNLIKKDRRKNEKTIEEMQTQLVETYKEWWQEVSQKGFNDDTYSNPFYCGIPSNWMDSDIRIMFCGEEGNGCWNKDSLSPSDIIKLQKHNLGYIDGSRENNFKTNPSAFWRRVKQIEFLKPNLAIKDIKNNVSTIPVIWTDCDKICAVNKNNRNGKLSSKERKLLHSVDTKILKKEIEILKPTHIVFLGWYTLSLKENSLYYYSEYQKTEDKYNYPLDIKTIMVDGNEIKLYYLYHPALRNNQDKYSKDIEKVISDIKADLEKK